MDKDQELLLLQQVQQLTEELRKIKEQLMMMTNLALASAPSDLVTEVQRQQAYNNYMGALQQQADFENNDRAFK